VASAIKNFPTTKCDNMPRLADFVRWVTAAEEGLGREPGTFVEAYDANRQSTNDEALSDPLAAAILTFMEAHEIWTGTATELLNSLTQVTERGQGPDELPRNASQLSNSLNRVGPVLRGAGIGFERPPRSSNGRKLTLRRI